jgi:hypothetical protein
VSYPSERLAEEVAFLAHYGHWSYAEIMGMDHRERQAWVRQFSRMNESVNELARQR